MSTLRPYPSMRRKPRADIPSLDDLREAVELAPADRREGSWTKLQLLEMDERFCQAMRRAHPELELGGQTADPEWRKQA